MCASIATYSYIILTLQTAGVLQGTATLFHCSVSSCGSAGNSWSVVALAFWQLLDHLDSIGSYTLCITGIGNYGVAIMYVICTTPLHTIGSSWLVAT